MRKASRFVRTLALAGGIAALLGSTGTAASTQAGQEISPVQPGEVLTYRAISGRFGHFGAGSMRVEGPVEVRGEQALQLAFDFRGRVGLFRIEDRTRSWVSAEDLSSLRYHKQERTPLGSRSEEVEIYPDEGRWTDASEEQGETVCGHPLDELSFLYFIRTLPLEDGAEYTLNHHFDPERNPVSLKVLRRESTKVPAGVFETVVVEMRVRDERVSAMRLYISDDDLRIPVRIESSAPWVGSTRLLLERVSRGTVATRQVE